MNTVYSTHILMLPFVFTESVEDVNKALVESEFWKYKSFDVGEHTENYNEYIYFYEYVRKALYSDKKMDDPKQISYYFEYREQKGTYILQVKGEKYELEVDGVSMRTFDTGVGILSLELFNTKYKDTKSVLLINDFARRTYPQFLGKEKGLNDVKNVLLAESISLYLDREIVEDFKYYEKMQNISKDATKLPAFIHGLLGDAFSSHTGTERIHIEPIIDDRMFVLSMYINDALADKMSTYDDSAHVYVYEQDSFWYEYVFIDGAGKTCQSKHMTKKLIAETTYDRWVEWGTLFGISRYSFVALTKSWFGKNRLEAHMRTMYFQMFSLLLAYRASILNFSKRVADVKVGGNEEVGIETLQKEVVSIYGDYINFQNNLFFRELTAQEQGIEIYNQALDVMDIERQLKDLDEEIAELHTYVSMKTEGARNDRLEVISKLGAVFLPPSFLAGIYGINTFEFSKSLESLMIGISAMILTALVGYLGVVTKSKAKTALSVVAMVVIMVGSLYWIGGDNVSKTTNNKENKIDVRQ